VRDDVGGLLVRCTDRRSLWDVHRCRRHEANVERWIRCLSTHQVLHQETATPTCVPLAVRAAARSARMLFIPISSHSRLAIPIPGDTDFHFRSHWVFESISRSIPLPFRSRTHYVHSHFRGISMETTGKRNFRFRCRPVVQWRNPEIYEFCVFVMYVFAAACVITK